jgi:Flp pilus assembly protein TadD
MRRIVCTRRLLRASRPLLAANVRYAFRGISTDITGCTLSRDVSSESLLNIDDSIMNTITCNGSIEESIQECLSEDPECGLANILHALSYLRNPPLRDPEKVVRKNAFRTSLQRLELQFVSLNEREKLLSAGLYAWNEGLFYRAASLFESAVLLNPNDVLALRMAQDCYLTSGDSMSTLTCITRCLQTFDDKHHLHGHILGMLATGYMENGRYTEAEETARRAVTKTRGRDIWAMHTLLNVFQLTGRSSELLASLEEHESKYDTEANGSGMYLVLFNKGCAFVQRGNYNGALRTFDYIMDMVESTGDSGTQPFVHATLLLWLITLNTAKSAVFDKWHTSALYDYWKSSDLNSLLLQDSKEMHSSVESTPLLYICKTLALCMSLKQPSEWRDALHEQQAEQENSPFGRPPTESKEINAALNSMFSFFNKDKSVDSDASTENKEGEESEKEKGISEAEMRQRSAVLQECIKDAIRLTEKIQYHHSIVQDEEEEDEDSRTDTTSTANIDLGTVGDSTGTIDKDTLIYENLKNMQPLFHLESRIPDRVQVNDHLSALSTCGLPLVDGLLAFTEQEFFESAQIMNKLHPILHRMGGSAVIRDIMVLTLIESLLREGMLTEARLMLSHRTAIAPHEAQSWKRLSHVFHHLGHDELAEVAHYTSWQLGIGQGGFGGPK